jgi:outer membrane lipoprotein LolB
VSLASRLTGLACRAGIFSSLLFVAGCAHQARQGGINSAQTGPYSGRISLQIQSEPRQAFFAAFELKGNAERGDLTLTSPIGSVLGVMRWSPGDARLETGRDVRHFTSVDALLQETTGAPIPVAALFDWLDGKSTAMNGWAADLTQRSNGRIQAKRSAPEPRMDLRIVLDQ